MDLSKKTMYYKIHEGTHYLRGFKKISHLNRVFTSPFAEKNDKGETSPYYFQEFNLANQRIFPPEVPQDRKKTWSKNQIIYLALLTHFVYNYCMKGR